MAARSFTAMCKMELKEFRISESRGKAKKAEAQKTCTSIRFVVP